MVLFGVTNALSGGKDSARIGRTSASRLGTRTVLATSTHEYSLDPKRSCCKGNCIELAVGQTKMPAQALWPQKVALFSRSCATGRVSWGAVRLLFPPADEVSFLRKSIRCELRN